MYRRFLIVEVPPGSAGASAGLCAGDVIEEYDGKRIDGELSQLLLEFQRASGRKSVSLILWRESRPIHLPVPGGDLGIRLVDAPSASPAGGMLSSPLLFLGLAICIVGSAISILYVPCQVFGVDAGRHFILSEAGFGAKTYQFINWPALLVQMLLINGLGVGIAFLPKLLAAAQQTSPGLPPSTQSPIAGRVPAGSSPIWLCPACGQTNPGTVSQCLNRTCTELRPPGQASVSAPPGGASAAPASPAAAPSADLRRCPYCAELIRKEAIRCRYCQAEVQPIRDAPANV